MMNNEFHEPFIKGMIIVGVFTIITMFTSKFVVEYYMSLGHKNLNTPVYTSQESQPLPNQ